jgi:putative oxidoreductase
VAISTTKVPILLDKGFWVAAHEWRTDWSMLLGSVFLMLAGAGARSLDAWLVRVRPAGWRWPGMASHLHSHPGG